MPVFTQAHLNSLLNAVAASRAFTEEGPDEEALVATAVSWCASNGFAGSEPTSRQEETMDPIKAVESLTTKHGSLDAAMDTADGRKVYAEYRESLLSGQRQAPAEQAALTDTRHFLTEQAGASVRSHERTFNERVSALLKAAGTTTPTDADRAAMAARLVESEPQLYAEYMKSLRGATTGG